MEIIKDEWYYSELLELLREKEREKEEAYYRPIELELPLYEQPQPIGDERPENKEEEKNRGVIIIDL